MADDTDYTDYAEDMENGIGANNGTASGTPTNDELMKQYIGNMNNKQKWVDAGIGALQGAATGALQALLTRQHYQPYKTPMPTGGNYGISKSSTPGVSFGRNQINADRAPSLALELLRKGGQV